MKILLSKPGEHPKRHIVVIAEPTEAPEVRVVLRTEVLEPGVTPITESFRAQGVPKVRFRLAMKYLEKTLLAFPFADVSDVLDKRLSKKARAEIQSMRVPNIEIDGINFEPYDFQKIAIARLVRRKRFLENDELGLGKTFISGAAAVHLIKRGKIKRALFVVTNTNKFPTWEAFFREQTDLDYEVVDGTAAQRRAQIARGADITVIHHEGLRAKYELQGYRRNEDGSLWTDRHGHRRREKRFIPVHPELFDSGAYDLIVVDEYQKFKNPSAQQTIGLHNLHAPYRWAMSGTPVVNGRPEEYWSTLHWLWPKRYPDYEQFKNKHLIVSGGRVTGYRKLHEVKSFIDERDDERNVPVRSIRRRKEWVSDDLPEVVYVPRVLDMTKEQRKLYREIQDDLRLRLENGEFRSINNALAAMTRLKQACFSPELYGGSPVSPKIDDMKEIMKELNANGEKALFFSQWSAATRILAREFEHYNPAYIDGDVTPRLRGDQVRKFNDDDDCRLFIGTIASCNSGISLGAGTYVGFSDLDWVPANNDQAVGRSAAGGLRGLGANVDHVHVVEWKMENSVEQKIDSILARKRAMNNRMTERDAGAAFKQVTFDDIRELLVT